MIRCPKCNREQSYSVVTCDCGVDLKPSPLQVNEQERLRETSSKPYNLTSILRVVLRLIGFLSIVGGVIYSVFLFVQGNSAWSIFVTFIGGFVMSIPYFSAGKAITILINMSSRQDKLISILERIERENSNPEFKQPGDKKHDYL